MRETDMIDLIKSKFPEAIQQVIEFRGETTLVIAPEALIDVALFLRDDPALKFDLLSDVSAVDYFPEHPRFAVNYHVYSMENNRSLRLKVQLDGETPHVASVTSVWPGANWHEREVWDLMGVRFDGHPDLRRIMLPEDYLGHPLRKDAARFYEEPQFTHNFDEVESRKPYAKE
jgi:NADH-quinone oxidoreductase subunit C